MGFAHAMTSVFCPNCVPPSRLRFGRLSPRKARGFTLVELIAVVVIIAVVAALAIPSIASRMRDRRTQQAAQTVAQLYTTARMRAMGRGAAVLVRYEAGTFQVREAIRGTASETDVNCQPLPVSSCMIGNSWLVDPTSPNRLITTFDPLNRSEFEGLRIEMTPASGGPATGAMDVCFTPMGAAFVSYSAGGALQRLTGVPVANVWREDSGTAVGLKRVVMIMPNGNSHLVASRKP